MSLLLLCLNRSDCLVSPLPQQRYQAWATPFVLTRRWLRCVKVSCHMLPVCAAADLFALRLFHTFRPGLSRRRPQPQSHLHFRGGGLEKGGVKGGRRCRSGRGAVGNRPKIKLTQHRNPLYNISCGESLLCNQTAGVSLSLPLSDLGRHNVPLRRRSRWRRPVT